MWPGQYKSGSKIEVIAWRNPGELSNDECVASKVVGGPVIQWGMLCGRRGRRFDSGLGNHKERTISFDIKKTCYAIWFTYICRKLPFTMIRSLKKIKICQNYFESKKRRKFWKLWYININLLTSRHLNKYDMNRIEEFKVNTKGDWNFSLIVKCLAMSAI